AAIVLADEIDVREPLLGRVAPEFLAHPLVHALGEGLGETVAERLHQDAVVIVVGAFEFERLRLDAGAGGDDEGPEPILAAGLERCDEFERANDDYNRILVKAL